MAPRTRTSTQTQTKDSSRASARKVFLSPVLVMGFICGMVMMLTIYQYAELRAKVQRDLYTEVLLNPESSVEDLRNAAKGLTTLDAKTVALAMLTDQAALNQLISTGATILLTGAWFFRERFHFLNYHTLVGSLEEGKKRNPEFRKAFHDAAPVIRSIQARRRVVEDIVNSEQRKRGGSK